MSRKKSILVWILAFIFTVATAYYQRITGPTYPYPVEFEHQGEVIKNRLIRTHGGDGDAEIRILVPDRNIKGIFKYRRYKSYDDWTETEMERHGDYLVFMIPHQPPAGKVSYQIRLISDQKEILLPEEPIEIRFKGAVPAYILILHIILIFAAMLYSNRAGMEVIFKGDRTYAYTVITVILIAVGGLIFGPILQKYAFGSFWTGWPFGHDLTDNKTFVALIAWVIALLKMRKSRNKTGWVLAAAIVTFIIFMIPHSVLGSEIDHTAQSH